MSTQPTSPSEADVLRAISDLFQGQSSTAALAHYPTLRIQTTNLHAALCTSISSIEALVAQWADELTRDESVSMEFRSAGTSKPAYRTIAPALVRNLHRTADFLMEETRARPAVSIDRVEETIPSFSDFVKLGASVRGFLDALVQTTYQLATFDGLQLNYKFLQSLLSFAAVAPSSLKTNITSPAMQTILDAYVALPPKNRKNSDFTKAAHEQFPQRLQVGAQISGLPDWRRRNLELLFSFCSDFVHSGYISVLAVGEPGLGIISGNTDDAFTPRAENFAELKQRLLAECAGAYIHLFLPTLRKAISRVLVADIPADWNNRLDDAIDRVHALREIVGRRLVTPIRRGLIDSDIVLHVPCMCGKQADLPSPHHAWDRFCPACGSRFDFHEVDDRIDYVISEDGVSEVLGGDAIKIAELDQVSHEKLCRIAAKHKRPHEEGKLHFLYIADLENCDEITLNVECCVTLAPKDADRARCTLFAFVAAKSMERCKAVRIGCNCGAETDYMTSDKTNVVQCSQCQTKIGLFGVTGDGEGIQIAKTDGSLDIAPIQARKRFVVAGVAIS